MAIRLSDEVVRRLSIGINTNTINQPNATYELYVTGKSLLKQSTNAALGIDTNLKIGTARKDLNIDVTNGTGTGINNGYAGGITFGQGDAAYAGLYYQTSGSYGSKLILATTSAYANGAYARVMINHLGNVGINTVAPNYKLHLYNGQTMLDNTTASSTTNQSSQLMVSNTGGGNVALELWRNANASWQISNEGGILHFRNNYTTAKQTTYVQDSITVAYNTGITTFNGTTDSTTTTNGTVIVKGGVGIAKELHVGTRIQIHSTAAVKHIQFTREGWNYVALPTNAATVLAFGFGDVGDNANQKLVITQTGVVRPGSANTESLGASDKAWAQIYGNGVHTNVANSNAAGGISLYSTDITAYGMALRTATAFGHTTSTTWAYRFYMSSASSDTNMRGWQYVFNGSVVAALSGEGRLSLRSIDLMRSSGTGRGIIRYYAYNRNDWVTYMSDTTASSAPNGATPSTIGSISWAIRNSASNGGNYGWIWESIPNNDTAATAPVAKMGLTSNTGRLFINSTAGSNTPIIQAYSNNATAANAYQWGLNHYDDKIAAGANTCLLTGFSNSTNNQAVFGFHYAGSNSNDNYLELGLYGNNNLFKLYKNNRLAIKAHTYPDATRTYTLGTSSYYWNGAYIHGNGNIHWNNLVKVNDATIVTTDTNRGLPRILINQSDVVMNGRGSKFWGLSPASVTLESTSDSGASWAAHTVYTTDSQKRGVTNGSGTSVTVGNLTYDSGSGNTAAVAVGHGVRITLSFEAEHRFGWIECMIIAFYTRGHTCSFKVERYNKNKTAWTTIEEGTLTNTNQNRIIYPATTWYMTGASSSSNASYANQLRVTMIVTALGTAQRYAPAIHGIYGYGAGNPSHSRNATYTSGRLFDLTTAQYGTPYYYNDRNSGTILAPVSEWILYGTGAWVAANTAAYASLTIGNANAQTAAGQHAEGRLIIYAKGKYYHLLKGHDTVGGGHYTHTLPNASGEIVQCRAAANGNTDYQTAILFNQNKSNYPTTYGTAIVMAYRKASDNAKPDYASQIYISNGNIGTYGDTMFYRTSIEDSWHDWQMVAHSVAKTAVGSGTQPIYITAAGTITASTSTVGGAAKPVYMASGVITACSSTVGGAAKPVYMSSGTITACSSTVGTATKPVYMSAGTITVGSYELKSTVNAGTANYVAYYSGANAVSSANATNGMIMPAHYYHTMYSNATTGTEVYVHYYNGSVTATNTNANLRVKNGSSFNTLRLLGGNGGITWDGGNISATAGYLISTKNSNTVTIGSQNASFCHIYNSADIPFIFNKQVQSTASFKIYNTTAVFQSNTCRVTATNGDVSIHSATNRGVYEFTDSKWIIYLQHSDDTVHSGYKIYNAVWNDFAEMREGDITEGGYAVYDDGHGHMKLCTERMQPGARLTSDTFGIVVGYTETAKTPIGVAGRVLVYPAQDRNNYHVGDAICAAPDGKVDLMTREEIMMYPDRILGIVSEIPTYEVWNQRHKAEEEKDYTETNVPVNGRIWVYVR